MSFNPHDFLMLARALATAGNSHEAEYRTAVSRAYYAAHLQARERLVAAGELVPTRSGEDHRLIVRRLRARGGSEGDQLDWLRIRRIRADYRLGAVMTAVQARQAVDVAQALWPRI